MRQLTLVRHGVTDWNVLGKFQGHSDIPLSPDGVEQAEALAAHLRGVAARVDVVYSSPLKRALETARIVFPEHDIVLDERLRELNFGEFESYTQAENETHYAWSEWFAHPFERPTPGGESYADLMTRAAEWLTALPKDATSFAFTHSGTIRMLVSHVLGFKPTWRKRIYLSPTSRSRILFRKDEAVIERVNDTRHLKSNGLDPFED